MTREKNPIWKDWRLWVAVIAVFIVIYSLTGIKKKDEASVENVSETSTVTEDKLATMGVATVRLGKCAVLKVADKVIDGVNLDDISYSITGHIDECQRLQSDSINAGDISDYNDKIDAEWERRKDEQLNGYTLTYWLQDWANK